MNSDYVMLSQPPRPPGTPERIEKIPTYQLEPFQMQRAHALELARQILPDADVFDLVRAASFIENGRTPD